MNNYLRYFAKVSVPTSTDSTTSDTTADTKPKKKVVKMKVKLKVKDVTGKFKFTDVMLQECATLTGYIINTKEMLKRNENPVKHYNILCRGGGSAIIVNNGGNVTSGLDFKVKAKNGTTGPIKLETLYRTRSFNFKDNLSQGEQLEIDSFKYKVLKSGTPSNKYTGSFLDIPAGFGMYNVDMASRDMGRFVFYIKEYDRGGNT